MDPVDRSKPRSPFAVALALVVAVCLLAAPVSASAAGFSLSDMFGEAFGQLGGADESSEPQEEAQIDPGYVVGMGPSLPPGAELVEPEPTPEPIEPEPTPEPIEPEPTPEPVEPEPTPAPDSGAVQAERPRFSDAYAQFTVEELPRIADDPVNQAAWSAVGYEAAGVLVWIPEDYEIVALDEAFVVALEGDLYVDVTQIYSDFEASGGEEALVEFLIELAAGNPDAELFPINADGVPMPYTNRFGTEFYAFRSVDEAAGEYYLSVYIPTLDGRLANLWASVPMDDADAHYDEIVEFIIESLMLVDPGTDPVDIAAIASGGQPAAAPLAEQNGLSFAAPGMEYDAEVDGWVCYDGYLVYVTTIADYFYGEEDLTEDDLYYSAAELAETDGFLMAEAYLENDGTPMYVYVGLSDDGFLEVYAFVPMGDGTVTMIACLADAFAPEAHEVLAMVLQSVAYADSADASGADLIGDGEAVLSAGDADAASPIIDREYLERNATLV